MITRNSRGGRLQGLAPLCTDILISLSSCLLGVGPDMSYVAVARALDRVLQTPSWPSALNEGMISLYRLYHVLISHSVCSGLGRISSGSNLYGPQARHGMVRIVPSNVGFLHPKIDFNCSRASRDLQVEFSPRLTFSDLCNHG